MFDLIGDVRDHLHSGTEIVTTPLFFDDVFVNLSRGEVIELTQFTRCETLVVAEVEVRLSTIVEHIDLTVLKGAHRAGVDIQVRVEFLNAHTQSTLFQECSERTSRQPFTERGDHASGDKNVFHVV